MQRLRERLRGPRIVRSRPDDECGPARACRRTLRVYLIKASKYDTRGSVLSFRWGVIPNNTLIVLAGLTADYAARHLEIDLQTVLWDELFDGVLSADLIASIGGRGCTDGVEVIVGLVGVQSNQYPRARDIALQFRRLGLPVVMGGFHVTSHAPSREFLTSAGVTTVAGEAENTWPALLDDYVSGNLHPAYCVTEGIRARTGLDDITVPIIATAPLPAIDRRYLGCFTNPTFSTIDTSRGCPFVCSYCSVKNVMGRTMRTRDPARVLAWMRDAYDEYGVRNLLIVDDDFFRSPDWAAILDGMVDLRRRGRPLSFLMQVDLESSVYATLEPEERETTRHRQSRRFVDLAAAAGCFQVFIGFESFNPANLDAVSKIHNEDNCDRRRAHDSTAALRRVKARYKRAIDIWHAAGVGVHCGYIIGLPFDGPGCGKQAAADLRDIGVDIASFFAYTPLPGTEDYEQALAAGAIYNHDFNDYDSAQFVMRHPLLPPDCLRQEYEEAYRSFYTASRLAWTLATLHRVPGLTIASRLGMLTHNLYYGYSVRRGWHPMLGGIWRRQDAPCRSGAITNEEAAQRYLNRGVAGQSPSTLQQPSVPELVELVV